MTIAQRLGATLGVMCAIGLASPPVRAQTIVTWSGTGDTGTDPYGLIWRFSSDELQTGLDSWGIPGLGFGTLGWNGPDDLSKFDITFPKLPDGVSISAVPPATTWGGFDDSTRFSNVTDTLLWNSAFLGSNTVEFTAPDAASVLHPGDSFFVNVVFTGTVPEADRTFISGYNTRATPEPGPLALLFSLLVFGGVFLYRHKAGA